MKQFLHSASSLFWIALFLLVLPRILFAGDGEYLGEEDISEEDIPAADSIQEEWLPITDLNQPMDLTMDSVSKERSDLDCQEEVEKASSAGLSSQTIQRIKELCSEKMRSNEEISPRGGDVIEQPFEQISATYKDTNIKMNTTRVVSLFVVLTGIVVLVTPPKPYENTVEGVYRGIIRKYFKTGLGYGLIIGGTIGFVVSF